MVGMGVAEHHALDAAQRAPAAATASVIALMPRVEHGDPVASSIRKTLIALVGKPPRTPQTPSATGSASLAGGAGRAWSG